MSCDPRSGHLAFWRSDHTPKMKSASKFVFLGAPGVGKGTFAKMIVDRSAGRWHHLSPGDYFRAEIKAGTAVGKELASYVTAGKLVPEEMVTNYWLPNVADTIARLDDDPESGIILDGYPRTVEQCQLLDQAIPCGQDFIAMNITLRRDMAVAKLLGRCHCRLCGQSYNTTQLMEDGYDMPPILPVGSCSKSAAGASCSETLSRRADDTPEVINERLAEYERHLEPILRYYRDQDRLAEMEVKKGVKDIDRLWGIMVSKQQELRMRR